MTQAQARTLKKGDPVIIRETGTRAAFDCISSAFGFVLLQWPHSTLNFRPDELDLPDTETPSMFEEEL